MISATRTVFGLGIHGWENIMVTSLAAAAFAAVVVGLSTWAVVQLQRSELQAAEAAMDTYKRESSERIAAADARAAEANSKAIDGARDIARLSADAEVARRETAAAQLQLEQLRFPRTINGDKFQMAVERLPPSAVEVLFDANAPDAAFLASTIWGVFFNAKWEMLQPSGPQPLRSPPPNILPWSQLPLTMAAGGGPSGLSVVTNEAPDLYENVVGKALTKALAEAIVGPPNQTTLGTQRKPRNWFRVQVAG